MKNNEEVAKSNQVTYSAKHSDNFGGLIIDGLYLPNEKYDPLGKIWANLKRRFLEQWTIQTCGLFAYGEEAISCSFSLNYAVAEQNGISVEDYEKKFVETFDEQMDQFESIIDKFIKDPNGYLAYCDYVETAGDRFDREECNKIFNAFLLKNGIRKQSDLLRKRENAEMIKEYDKKCKEWLCYFFPMLRLSQPSHDGSK